MHLTFNFNGRTALVTGAAQGIGLEIARGLTDAGARVFLNGRNAQSLNSAIHELENNNGEALAACFDISDQDAVFHWFEREAPPLDILINNASNRDRRNFDELDRQAFDDMLQTNLVAAYDLSRRFALQGADANDRAIVNIASIAGLIGRPDDPAYVAAKGGLIALTRSLAIDFAPSQIRCNAVAPGFIATETNKDMIEDPDVNAFLERRVPMRRWGRAEDIAAAVLFLASPAAGYINGHVLTVDGGLTTSF